MKKIVCFIALLIGLTFSGPVMGRDGIQEKDLPHEANPIPESERPEIQSAITVHGYVSSKDITVVDGMMACVYYFCQEEHEGFCSDFEGIIVATGTDTGRVPRVLKELDQAINSRAKLVVRLSSISTISGIPEIIDVVPLQKSI